MQRGQRQAGEGPLLPFLRPIKTLSRPYPRLSWERIGRKNPTKFSSNNFMKEKKVKKITIIHSLSIVLYLLVYEININIKKNNSLIETLGQISSKDLTLCHCLAYQHKHKVLQ